MWQTESLIFTYMIETLISPEVGCAGNDNSRTYFCWRHLVEQGHVTFLKAACTWWPLHVGGITAGPLQSILYDSEEYTQHQSSHNFYCRPGCHNLIAHLLLCSCLLLHLSFNLSCSDRYVVISYCSFNLHDSTGKWWTSFHVPFAIFITSWMKCFLFCPFPKWIEFVAGFFTI